MRQPHGQNFLTDKNIAHRIIESADIQKTDIVIEIGPGKAALTDILKDFTDNLIAVDIDSDLAQALQTKYKDNKNITIINRDFLKFDLPDTKFKIVANLPYNVGTAIVQKFLPNKNFVSGVIMLQKDLLVTKELKITDIFLYSDNIMPMRSFCLMYHRDVLIRNRKLCRL